MTKASFLATLEKNTATEIGAKNNNALTEIDGRLEELQMQLVKMASTKADYEDVAEEFYRLWSRCNRRKWKMPTATNCGSGWLIRRQSCESSLQW